MATLIALPITETRPVPNTEIGPSSSLADLEDQLGRIPPTGEEAAARLKVESFAASDLLTDLWGAILCGTLCRRATTEIVYGEPTDGSARFSNTLTGLVAASLAASIRDKAGNTLDGAELRQNLMLRRDGLVSPDSDVAQTLVEFDPDFPISPLFHLDNGAAAPGALRRRLFQSQVLRFRQMLDLGALRRGGGAVGSGAAGDLGTFLSELHENGLEHGSRDGRQTLVGTRFMRLRTHAAPDATELAERCGPFRQLRRYVERTFGGDGPVTLVEAAISDFGRGIVDAYQASPAGLGPDVNRRDLLERLIYGRLTSKSSDPSAGLGIQYALDAARRMNAFVSLRTAEFWMAVSFLPDRDDPRLVHLGDRPHPSVAGTHWQMFWPQP
ncbi:hypothetical protein [Sphingomonas sp.]|jgi:hypothetical protein|uniref:hypothetical protein n=1 Tax=Sphingomonas sp. TaxID=28214 RepID=UPI002E2F0046|nr:hypothetical protein [Sphingomonas sp.]HEX4693554.1 hypothetical protein [Sphingomonas sp.]